MEPLGVAIDEVDFVRETTRVSVRYAVEDSWWQWAEANAATQGADVLDERADVR